MLIALPKSPTLRQEQGYLILCLLLLGISLALQSTLALALLALAELLLLYGLSSSVQRVSPRATLLLGGSLLLSVLPIALVRADGGRDFLIHSLGWGITSESLALALRTFLRCSCAIAATRLLLLFVPLYRLYAVLHSVGVPKLFIELVELTYRYIFMLEETAGQIRLAQTSRLGYQGGIKHQLEHFAMLLARTFILSQTEADRLYLGLVSRGYDDEPTAPQTTTMSSSSSSSQPSVPLLAAQGLSFSYAPGQATLDQLQLTIQQGERIALLGHNGAGKSSLFLLLAGLQESWNGKLNLHGQEVAPKDRILLRKHIALVLQNSNYQLFTPSVEEEISFGLKNLGLQGQALSDRLEAILDHYDLQPLRHKPPHQLSEGQKKWVALAAILATEPEIILLDEPTAALDQRATRRVLHLLEELHQAGKTIILSTHDMELAASFADRILLLEEGKLTADRSATGFWGDSDLLTQAELSQPHAWRSIPRSTLIEAHPRLSPKYHLPLFLSADLLPVLFIGGGKGIWRKAQGLLERQLPFTVLSEELCPELQTAYKAGGFTWHRGHYTGCEDLSAFRILIAGIGDEATEQAWGKQWREQGFLYALLSDPDAGNIQFGATTHEAGITLSVHSDYRLPEIAVLLREHWIKQLPTGFEADLIALAELRQAYLNATTPEERAQHEAIYRKQKQQILNTMSNL